MKHLTHLAVAAGLIFAAVSAHAVTLVSNGPVVNSSGLSVLTAPASTYGFGSQTASGNSVAEDFTVAAGQTWNVQSLNFYSYQTGTTTFPLLTATWSVVRGDVNTGAVVATATTSLTSEGRVGYRVLSTTPADTTRAIWSANADVTDFSLSAGSYWLRWSLTGSGASGPWTPPTSDAFAGNAMQSLANGTFALAIDTGSGLTASLPFAINGTVAAVPEASTLAMLMAGGLIVAGIARRRREPR